MVGGIGDGFAFVTISRESLLTSLFFVTVFAFTGPIAQVWVGIIPAYALSLAVAAIVYEAVTRTALRFNQRPLGLLVIVTAFMIGAICGWQLSVEIFWSGAGWTPYPHPPE